jgi:hypothetical protein
MKTKLILLIFIVFGLTGMMPETSSTSAQPSQVISFTNLTRSGQEIMLGDRILVRVANLDSLLAMGDTARLTLFLGGIAMTEIQAESVDTLEVNGVRTGTVIFKVDRCDDEKCTRIDPWDVFYVSAKPEYWKRELPLSVGYNGVGAIKSTSAPAILVIIRVSYFWMALISSLLIIGLFIYLNNLGVLRDYSSLPLKERPFSLSRSQLAFWTLIVSISYLFISLVTGELAPLTTSTLILLGISGATTAAAGVIDKSDVNNTEVTRSQDVTKSVGFFTDIMSDASGVSVHRFQMVVFNFILGLFFINQVFTKLEMPVFDDNLLILMGLSNVTYAGLKANENKMPSNPPVPPQNPPAPPPVEAS